jgi:hypothetical protein
MPGRGAAAEESGGEGDCAPSSTSYDPETSRVLAENAEAARGSADERSAASDAFERYHSVGRMLRLATEVTLLRKRVEQGRRIRHLPEFGYVDVRHMFDAIRRLSPVQRVPGRRDP